MSKKQQPPLHIEMDPDELLGRLIVTDPKEVTAAEVGAGGAVVEELATPQGWSVSLQDIISEPAVRLDAEHYDPRVIANMEALRRSSHELKPLSELADIRLPSQFTRIWAQDTDHGVPYVNATDLMSYAAFGLPAQTRFLSRASEVDVDNLLIHEGWILVTCSGTIGRVFEVPKSLEGWAATHDIIRVIPHDDALRGYIRAFLCSESAQVQILKHTHGGQIDHITDDQLGSCLVPMLPDAEMKRLSAVMDEAERAKQEAAASVAAAVADITQGLADA